MARHGGKPAGASGTGDELLDVVVIGGSQAGLAIAWHLTRQHCSASTTTTPPTSPTASAMPIHRG